MTQKTDGHTPVWEAIEWLVDQGHDTSVPYVSFFPGWYADNAAQYTVVTAWDYYNGYDSYLVLRSEQGQVPDTLDSQLEALLSSHEPGRETVLKPQRSGYPGVIMWT